MKIKHHLVHSTSVDNIHIRISIRVYLLKKTDFKVYDIKHWSIKVTHSSFTIDIMLLKIPTNITCMLFLSNITSVYSNRRLVHVLSETNAGLFYWHVNNNLIVQSLLCWAVSLWRTMYTFVIFASFQSNSVNVYPIVLSTGCSIRVLCSAGVEYALLKITWVTY